jgi:hypothetical protein
VKHKWSLLIKRRKMNAGGWFRSSDLSVMSR